MEVYLLEIYKDKEANIPDFGLVFKSMDLLLKYTEQHIQKLQPNFHDDAEELKDTGLALSLNDEETVRVTILPVIEDADDDKYNEYVSHKGHKKGESDEDDKGEEGKTHHGKKSKGDDEEEEEEEEGGKDEEGKAHHEDEDKDEHNKGEKGKAHQVVKSAADEDEEDEEGDGGKMIDGVYVTDGGETEIPSKSENTTTVERIKDGDTLIDFHDNKDNKENPKYMLMSTFEKLHTPKIDPWNRLPILRATTYKAKIKHTGANTRNTRKNEKQVHSSNSA
jgi:hypothetical protein